jgi:6-phosphogluconolactonase
MSAVSRLTIHYVESVGMWRVTLTPVILNAARHVAFLVAGADKAEMLSRVLEGPYQPAVLPAQIIKPTHGELRWLVDAAAAAHLRGNHERNRTVT